MDIKPADNGTGDTQLFFINSNIRFFMTLDLLFTIAKNGKNNGK